MAVEISFVDEHPSQQLTEQEQRRIESTLQQLFVDHGVTDGELSIAIFDDPTIQQYNQKYLDHDWPTDVISFLLSDEQESLDGQLLVSRDTAEAVAEELPWDGGTELLLYTIHGALHLIGYEDSDDSSVDIMRHQERKYLEFAGVPDAAGHPHFQERSKLTAFPDDAAEQDSQSEDTEG